MLVDTHAHLFWDSYEDTQEIIERAKKVLVKKIVIPSVDRKSFDKAYEILQQYPDIIKVGVGVHPEYLVEDGRSVEDEISYVRVSAKREGVVAIGEIGLDFYTEELRSVRAQQIYLFRQQVEIALEHDLPVIIHTRESIDETLEIVREYEGLRGVFHCFSGNQAQIERITSQDMMVSFCGNISWSKRVSKLVKEVGNNYLLLETDSPFMTPRDQNGEPYNGNLRNEPANVRILANIQANLRSQSVDDLIRYTGENAKRLFSL